MLLLCMWYSVACYDQSHYYAVLVHMLTCLAYAPAQACPSILCWYYRYMYGIIFILLPKLWKVGTCTASLLSCNSFFVVNTYRMEKSALPALAVILALALGCGAFFNQPPDKFDDNSLLMCYVTNPFFRTGRDQPARVLEDPPLIPLQQLSEFDQVWLPVSSG